MSENYVDKGDTVQFTCFIDIDTGPNYNNLHLTRLSGSGDTCGVCDQLLAQPPNYEGFGLCRGDTSAEYSIQCEWNPSSTVITFTVTSLTAMELTEWMCTSRGYSGSPPSLTLDEFGQLPVANTTFPRIILQC